MFPKKKHVLIFVCWFANFSSPCCDLSLTISQIQILACEFPVFFPLNHVMRNNIKLLNHASSFQLVKIQFICQNHLESSFSWLVNASDSAIFIHFPHISQIYQISRELKMLSPPFFQPFPRRHKELFAQHVTQWRRRQIDSPSPEVLRQKFLGIF